MLAVPRDYNAELETGTVNGGIKLDFPVELSGRLKNELETTLGEGGAPLRVRTTNGEVRLKHSNSGSYFSARMAATRCSISSTGAKPIFL